MNLIDRLFKTEEQLKKDWRIEASRKGGKNHKPNHEPKKYIVENWQKEHPDNFNMADCIRDTGLSKPTVYKYFKKSNDALLLF